MSTESLHLAPMPIRLHGCRKHFGGQRVLESVDLDITVNETVVLLDPLGCGKTTTLRIVAGSGASDVGGTVHFGDEDVTARPAERRHVGMVFRSYVLLPDLSVRDNVEYGLRIQRQQSSLSNMQVSAWTNTLLEMMHLTPYADHGVAQLPGGQRQHVALARVLAPEPCILLLDEPLAVLNAKLRESICTEIDRLLRGLGITTIYVTHDQGEAMALANRIVVMEADRIAQVGTPREIYFQLADQYVADFIGVMNRLGDTREDGVSACAGGCIPVPTGDGNAIFFRPRDAVLADPVQVALKDMIKLALFLGLRTRVRVADVSATSLFTDVPNYQWFALGHAVGFDTPVSRLLTLQA